MRNENISKENNNKKNKKKVRKEALIGIIVLALLVVVFIVIYSVFAPKSIEGAKTITIEVLDKEQNSTVYEVQTDAEYLREAMEDADGLAFSGSEGGYGLMIDTVNGVTADYSVDGSYWGFYVNGKYCDYGIETQPVFNGDEFQIIYTIGTGE